MILIKPWSQASSKALAIRTTVFVQEQGVPEELEVDEFDDTADHALAYIGLESVGTARLIHLSGGRGQIGRMAVLEAHRGKGIGTKLLRTLIHQGRGSGIREFELHAQVTALPFYEKIGFQAYGDIYDEAGIQHRNMILLLQ